MRCDITTILSDHAGTQKGHCLAYTVGSKTVPHLHIFAHVCDTKLRNAGTGSFQEQNTPTETSTDFC